MISLAVRLIIKITFGEISPKNPARLIRWKMYTIPKMAIPAMKKKARTRNSGCRFNVALFMEPHHPQRPKAKDNQIERGCKEILMIIIELSGIAMSQAKQ